MFGQVIWTLASLCASCMGVLSSKLQGSENRRSKVFFSLFQGTQGPRGGILKIARNKFFFFTPFPGNPGTQGPRDPGTQGGNSENRRSKFFFLPLFQGTQGTQGKPRQTQANPGEPLARPYKAQARPTKGPSKA